MSLTSPGSTSTPLHLRSEQIQRVVVSAEQMSQIEARVFAAGMPVAALMEKVAVLIAQRIQVLYPIDKAARVGVLVGPGHNGGDALVVARELQLSGYQVVTYQPFAQLKDLTAAHAQYASSLGIPSHDQLEPLAHCDLLIDGLFGFGLTRHLQGTIAAAVNQINAWTQPVVSIDLPSGLQTDTGATLGTAIQATQTLCLGLWKRAFVQESALAYIGQAELIDFGLPLADIIAVLGESPTLQRITPAMARAALPLVRSASTHKYKQGHLLLICGSRQYMGAAILAGLAARASGVGMLSIAVPESMRLLLIGQIPDALVIGCPEAESGEIARLPPELELSKYNAIACGCGITSKAVSVIQQVLTAACPLVLDADGLNILSNLGTLPALKQRPAPTVLTPHLGEFKRLFPELAEQNDDRIAAAQTAAHQSGAIVLLKGARTAIASPQGNVWLNPESTPALARGGTGDVLTGLMGGLTAHAALRGTAIEQGVFSAAWWHSQAGIAAARERSELGVDASTLLQYLIPALQSCQSR